MSDKINHLLATLAQERVDRPLISLENDVARAFKSQLHNSSIAIFGPLQFYALGIALIMGVTIGGMSGASHLASSQPSLFAVEERLAISTILEGG